MRCYVVQDVTAILYLQLCVTVVTNATVTHHFKEQILTNYLGQYMISDDWNRGKGAGFSRRVLGSVKPEAPLKNKIESAQQKLSVQVTKLSSIQSKLQVRHDIIFERIVNAQRNHDNTHAKAYASELSQVRKMKAMVSNAKLSMEQIQLRLNTVSELGDVVVTLSPCMSIIRGLSSSITSMMPEAHASIQDFSSMLGDVMNSSSVENVDVGVTDGNNSDANAILAEAQSILEKNAKSIIPDVPTNLDVPAAPASKEGAVHPLSELA